MEHEKKKKNIKVALMQFFHGYGRDLHCFCILTCQGDLIEPIRDSEDFQGAVRNIQNWP